MDDRKRHTVDRQSRQQVLFSGLIYNEQGRRAEVVYIGGEPHYAIDDDGFLRHVEAYRIDDAVLRHLKEQITSVQNEVVLGMLQLLGKDDLFTKAALEASIRNLEDNVRQGNPDQWVPWLRLYGFRVVVDVRGNIIDVIYPTQPAGGGGE